MFPPQCDILNYLTLKNINQFEMSEKYEDSNQYVAIDEQMYQVESILKKKVMNGVTQYLVKWRGWDDAGDCTWEPIDNLTNVKDLIREFQDKRIEKTKRNERPEKQQDASMEIEQKQTKKRKLIKESQKIQEEKQKQEKQREQKQREQKQKEQRTPSKKKSRNQFSIDSSQEINKVRRSREKINTKMRERERKMSQSSSNKSNKKREGSKKKSILSIGRVNNMLVKQNNQIFYEVNMVNSKKQCIGVLLKPSQQLKKEENQQFLLSFLERFLQDHERNQQYL